MSYAVGCRCGSDLSLLWLWHKLAAAAPIQILAWELPYATGVALKKRRKKKNPKTPLMMTITFTDYLTGQPKLVDWKISRSNLMSFIIFFLTDFSFVFMIIASRLQDTGQNIVFSHNSLRVKQEKGTKGSSLCVMLTFIREAPEYQREFTVMWPSHVTKSCDQVTRPSHMTKSHDRRDQPLAKGKEMTNRLRPTMSHTQGRDTCQQKLETKTGCF